MSLIEWQPAFEVGIQQIDDQHKELVGLINRLQQTVHHRDSEAEVQAVLVKLVDYVRYHFASEEQLMAEQNYAGTDRHAELHQRFVRKIADYLKRLKAGGSISAQELLSFLKQWLIEHIMREDTKLRVLKHPIHLHK